MVGRSRFVVEEMLEKMTYPVSFNGNIHIFHWDHQCIQGVTLELKQYI